MRPLTFSRNIYRLNTLNIRRLFNSSLPTVTEAISYSVLFIICKSVTPPKLYGADSANPLVVTLATPFIEIHRADFGERPALQ